jgi:hypothetical protein
MIKDNMNVFLVLQGLQVAFVITAGVLNYLTLVEIKNEVSGFRQEMYSYTEFVITQTMPLVDDAQGHVLFNPAEPYCVPIDRQCGNP